MRWMSFALTQPQMRARTKSVTRRLGWRFARAGLETLAVSKSQGRKKGEKPEVFGVVRHIDIRREPLFSITPEDVVAEGFPHMTCAEFIAMFCEHNRCDEFIVLTRMEFEFRCENCKQYGTIRVDGMGSWLCASCGCWYDRETGTIEGVDGVNWPPKVGT